jgi:acetyltransferase-like isoleucine patch superfamily enzyme
MKPGYYWARFWMQFTGLGTFWRMATWFATWSAPPYKGRLYLASTNRRGFVSPKAEIHHQNLRLGSNVFIGDRVQIFQAGDGGAVELDDRVRVYADNVLETGQGGSIRVGKDTRIHRGSRLLAYKAAILIGDDVGVSPNCAFYSYDHGLAPGLPISEQLLQTKGPIIVGDHVWLGDSVIVLSGVRIGAGAVVAAGAIVTHDVPAAAIVAGVPARVIKIRGDQVPRSEAG